MAVNTQTIRVDLNTGNSMPVAFAHQNDTNRQLTFQLYNNGVAFIPSNTSVKFGYISPIVNGGYTVIAGSNMASGSISGNTVTFTLPSTYTAVHGVGLLTMILTTSGATLRPINIKFVVQKSPDGADVISGASDFPTKLKGFVDNWFDNNSDEYLDAWLTGALAEQDLESVVNNWLDEHPEATTTVQDKSLTLKKIARTVSPDDFTGTDDQKLSDAINSLEYGGIVLLDRDYNLTDNVVITRNSNDGIVIVRAINGTATINCRDHEFGGNGESDGRRGGICFEGIIFVGTGNLIDGYYLIRIFFKNCYFSGFEHLCYNSLTSGRRYIQTVYFIGCTIRRITGYIVYLPSIGGAFTWLYDVRMLNNIIEWSYGVLYAPLWSGVYIDENAIEGFTGDAPLIAGVQLSNAASISNNYFEKNLSTTIDLSEAVQRNVMNIDISNNLFDEYTKTDGQIILLPSQNQDGTIKIANNLLKLAENGNGYGIAVPETVSSNMYNVDITGNHGTVYDPNGWIKNTRSLQRLYSEELYKTDYVVNQLPGLTNRFVSPVSLHALTSGIARASIPFPFYAENTNYSISIQSINVSDLGNVTNNASVYEKSNGGIIVNVTGTFTRGNTFVGKIVYEITFS